MKININNEEKKILLDSLNSLYSEKQKMFNLKLAGKAEQDEVENLYKKIKYLETPKTKKNKTTAILLALFLGGFGAHKFYLKQDGWGVLYLIFFWTYIPAILGFFEAISLAFYSEENFDKKFNK